MRWFRKKTEPTAGPARERRRNPRMQSTVLSCHLGEVADVSSSGLRIVSAGPPPVKRGDAIRVSIASPYDSVDALGRVTRIGKCRYGSAFEIGVEFADLSPEVAKALLHMAEFGFSGEKKRAPAATVSLHLPDFYGILGVRPQDGKEQIHQAYRRLARLYHPDVNKDPVAESRFKAIAEAYAMLRDDAKRRMYDDQVAAVQAAA